MKAASPAELLFVERAMLELERTLVRLRRRWPSGEECPSCGATNPVALGKRRRVPLCYRCRTGVDRHAHSLPGEHLPPRVAVSPNEHLVLNEVQRILDVSIVPGVRTQVVANVAALIALRLVLLGTLEAAA